MRLQPCSIYSTTHTDGSLKYNAYELLAFNFQPKKKAIKESLTDYIYLDHSIGILSFLNRQLERTLRDLLAHLNKDKDLAERIIFRLYNDANSQYQIIELKPKIPTCNLQVYSEILDKKLEKFSLNKAIREFEVQILLAEKAPSQKFPIKLMDWSQKWLLG